LPDDVRNFDKTADKGFEILSEEPQNYNQYVYCINSPINNIDHDGHLVQVVPLIPEIIEGVAVGIGAVAAAWENIKGLMGIQQGPVGKAGRKKRGREVNTKARQKPGWRNQSGKDPNRPMKKHKPGNHTKDAKSNGN
jgi:hypothetical protein